MTTAHHDLARASLVRHRVLFALCFGLALWSSACGRDVGTKGKPSERVAVETAALLTCGSVGFTSCTSTATSFTCAVPAGGQTNDVLVASYAGTGATAPAAATSGTSWTTLTNSNVNSSSLYTTVFYKTWAATDSTAPTFTGTVSASPKYVGIGLWRGCSVPTTSTAGATVTSGNVVAANATSVTAGQMVVNAFSAYKSPASTFLFNAQGAGYTNGYSPAANSNINIALSYRNNATGTVTGDTRSLTTTYTGARDITFVLPAGSAGTGGAGAICTANGDCASGTCAGGFCCSGACTGANGTASCAVTTGTCSVACNAGFGDCSGGAANGCEVNLTTTAANCGACGTVCATNAGTTANVCSASTCSPTCAANFANCDGNAPNGCEASIKTDVLNCNACGTVCSTSNITRACSAGSCSAGTCSAGFADCNGNKQTDGCEINTNTDVLNCNACGTVCSTANITRACSAGSCSAGACTAGFADCNGNKQTDGCEINLTNNASNCGACGTVCATNTGTTANVCSSSACSPTCAANYASCDGNAANGCETNVKTDVLNCNACGTVCSTANITRTCSAGSCSAGTCTAGFADCNGNKQTDGCEINTNTDAANCGACGTICATNAGTTANTCSAGSCSPTCAAGYLNCDGSAANGCEKAINAPTSCGTTCGNTVSCDDGNACTTDTCTAGACTHPAGNAGGVCRASADVCDVAEVCPSVSFSSNVDSSTWSDYGTAPSWNCTTSTTLSSSITSSTTSVGVASSAGFTASAGAIMVDDEIMFVTSTAGNTFTVARGQLGTTAASHNSGAVVGGVTVIDSTGAGSACPAVTRDTCGGTVTVSACTNSVVQSGGPNVMVVRLKGMTITNKHLIQLSGDKPIVFLVQGNATVDTGGWIDASASGTAPGPGGSMAGQCGGGAKPSTGTASAASNTGGGGGGFGTAGGFGAKNDGTSGAAGGLASTGTSLQPLLGGCSGGMGANSSANAPGGAGGGAFQISASGTITIGHAGDTASTSGTLSAGGGGSPAAVSSNLIGSGGGGSGGGILLEASITPPFGTNGAARVHGGGAGAARGFSTGNAGADGHSADDTAAAGGTNDIFGGSGGAGGTCAGNNCATSGAGADGLRSSIASFDGGGGGGGGGRVQVLQHGAGGQCPADTFATSSTVCRAAVAGGCDVAETCTGTSAACPADAFALTGTQCRAVAGACDVAETCNGTNTCPADTFASSGTVCRPTVGACDPAAETCTGTSVACPADTFASNSTQCRAAATVCDAAENCTGSSTTCPADAFAPSSTVCRTAVSVCDVTETCTGSSNACPTDAFAAISTVCRAAASVCDAAETCTGSSSTCPTDAFAPSTTPCRDQADVCDAQDFCTGTSSTCPDTFALFDSDCGYTTGGLVIYSTGVPTNSVDTSSGFSSQSVTNAGPTSAWSDALKFTATSSSSFTSRSDYWKISTTAHTFAANEYIEYDVYLAHDQAAIGGIDVATSSGYLRNSVGPAFDQNTLSSDPVTDISPNAYGQWYHRRFPLTGLGIVGKSSTKWDVVDESDNTSAAYTAYYDNIMVAVKAGACDGAHVCKLKDDETCTLASECARGVCYNTVCGAGRADGVACKKDSHCLNGHCVDGVCCATACAGGTTDCQACSIAAGAASNGTCGVASSTTVCRPSIASCDIADLCDGTSTACTPDNK